MPAWTAPIPAPGSGRVVISTLAPEAFGAILNAAPTSVAWTSANRAIYQPFRIGAPLLVAQLWCLNGATNGNNLDIGVYDAEGNRRVSSGSTAQGTVSTLQAFDVTDTLLLPGLYSFALACDGTTSTLITMSITSAIRGQWMGVAQQASAFALPATFTLSTITATTLPIVGLTGRTVI